MRDGRYGAYVNWAKVNATIPKGTAPDAITLGTALELLAEREGKPTAQPRKARTAAAKNAASRAKPAAPKKPAAKKAAAAKPKAAASAKRR